MLAWPSSDSCLSPSVCRRSESLDVEVFASGFTREMQHALEQEQGPHSQEEGMAVAEESTEEHVQAKGDQCITAADVSSVGLSDDETPTATVRGLAVAVLISLSHAVCS